jgi:hypothetical protein
VDGNEMKRRGAIPKKEGSLIGDIYCKFCRENTTWCVHRVCNNAVNGYLWTVTCLGCKYSSFEFAYEPYVQSAQVSK